MSTTNISDDIFRETQTKEEEIEISEENISKIIVDFSVSLETRLKALKMFYKNEGGNNTIETINKLSTIYEMSGTKNLREYLYNICLMTDLEPFLQSIAARSLWSFNKKDDLAYEAIINVYLKFDKNIGTPYRIDFIKMIMYNEKYKETALKYFSQILSDSSLNSTFKLKTIHSLESDDLELKQYFMTNGYLTFLRDENNDTRERIIAGQCFLKMSNENSNGIQDIILCFGENEKNDYNTRADALDVILQYGTTDYKERAKVLIQSLGFGEGQTGNIYQNRQNVHTREIENSVLEALEFLQTFEIMKFEGKQINTDFVQKKILEEKLDEKEVVLINSSFNRINLDRAIYSKYNCTLSHILLKIWTYLSGHKNEDEIRKRLKEELLEMSGTCSSGFASRLINTISGFGNFSLRISWEDQIISNLSGRLNAKIRDMDNLTLQEKVITEMTIPSSDYEKRKNFLKFFRKNMCQIREEMYEEFKNHISDVDFDLFFRKGVSMYEMGEKN